MGTVRSVWAIVGAARWWRGAGGWSPAQAQRLWLWRAASACDARRPRDHRVCGARARANTRAPRRAAGRPLRAHCDRDARRPAPRCDRPRAASRRCGAERCRRLLGRRAACAPHTRADRQALRCARTPVRHRVLACGRDPSTCVLSCNRVGTRDGRDHREKGTSGLMVGVMCRCGACVVLLCSSVLVRAGLVRFLVAASAACHTPAIPAPGTDSSAMPRASAGAVGPALAALFLVIIADGVHSRAIIEASCRLHAMPCHAIPCISCHATPRHAIPSHPMPCKVQDATLHNTRAADHRGEPRLVPAPPAAPLRNDVPD